MLQLKSLIGDGDLKSALTSHMETQNMEFVQHIFGLALVQYFLILLPFFPFCNGKVYFEPLYVRSM